MIYQLLSGHWVDLSKVSMLKYYSDFDTHFTIRMDFIDTPVVIEDSHDSPFGEQILLEMSAQDKYVDDNYQLRLDWERKCNKANYEDLLKVWKSYHNKE